MGRVMVKGRVRVRGDGEGDGQSSSQGQDQNQSSGQGQGWVPISSTCESGAHATPTTSPEWPRSEAADLRSRGERGTAVGDKDGHTGTDTRLSQPRAPPLLVLRRCLPAKGHGALSLARAGEPPEHDH